MLLSPNYDIQSFHLFKANCSWNMELSIIDFVLCTATRSDLTGSATTSASDHSCAQVPRPSFHVLVV